MAHSTFWSTHFYYDEERSVTHIDLYPRRKVARDVLVMEAVNALEVTNRTFDNLREAGFNITSIEEWFHSKVGWVEFGAPVCPPQTTRDGAALVLLNGIDVHTLREKIKKSLTEALDNMEDKVPYCGICTVDVKKGVTIGPKDYNGLYILIMNIEYRLERCATFEMEKEMKMAYIQLKALDMLSHADTIMN